MSSLILFRWSGLATILGGVLLPTSWILRFVFNISRPYTGTVEFIATILLVFGFMGLYGFQHAQSGVLGFLGFVLLIIHCCCALGECWLQNGEITGVAAVLAPIVGAIMLLGFILLGACYANSDSPIPTDLEERWHEPARPAIPLPAGLEEEWRASARQAIPLLAELLAEPQPELDLRYLFSCLAAFHGYQWLAKKLETLDVITDGET